jgi:F-type H+-transporting ATPase subunit delta
VRSRAPFGASLTFNLSEDIERVENSGGIGASLSGRYATALFELAREGGKIKIERVEASLNKLRAALDQSDDFRTLTTSPVLSRGDAANGVNAAAGSLGLDPITTNFLGVLAQNRRLNQLPAVIRAFRMLAARHRGETTAEVTSAHPLDDEQVAQLKAQLKARLGSDVNVELSLDPAILGGLVVRIGSQMIDSSLRTRLNSLAHAMKG